MPVALRFGYYRSVAPMMWVLVALAGTELLVVHFLLALWRPWIALLVSALTVPAIVWLVLTIGSFKHLPVLIEGDRLVMRTGRLHCIDVPITSVAGFRETWTAAELKARGVSNLALIAWPNIWIDLAGPVSGRRGPIHSVAHKLDDPAAFRTAIAERMPQFVHVERSRDTHP